MKKIHVNDAKAILEQYKEMKKMKGKTVQATYLVVRLNGDADMNVFLVKGESTEMVRSRFLDASSVDIYSVQSDETLEAKKENAAIGPLVKPDSIFESNKEAQLLMDKFVFKKQINLGQMEAEKIPEKKKKELSMKQLSMKQFTYQKKCPVSKGWLKKLENDFQTLESDNKFSIDIDWMDDEEGDSMVRDVSVLTGHSTIDNKLTEKQVKAIDVKANWMKKLKAEFVELETNLERFGDEDDQEDDPLHTEDVKMVDNEDIAEKVSKADENIVSCELDWKNNEEADSLIRDIEIDENGNLEEDADDRNEADAMIRNIEVDEEDGDDRKDNEDSMVE